MELYEKRHLEENDCQSQGPQLPEWIKILDFYISSFKDKTKYQKVDSGK